MARLEKAALLSQILGAAVVVVSLIYVGQRISDNTTEVRANSARELVVFGQYVAGPWERAFYYRLDGLIDDDCWAAWAPTFSLGCRWDFEWPNGKPDDTWRRVWRASGRSMAKLFAAT
jgi:hypothetical protein